MLYAIVNSWIEHHHVFVGLHVANASKQLLSVAPSVRNLEALKDCFACEPCVFGNISPETGNPANLEDVVG